MQASQNVRKEIMDSDIKKTNPHSTAPVSPVKEKVETIPRPMNSFMVWSRTRKPKIALENPKMNHSEIRKRLGVEWKQLNENEKRPFIDEAERLRQEHKRLHPDFEYNPRRKPKPTAKSEEPVMPYGVPYYPAFNQRTFMAPQVGVYAPYPMYFPSYAAGGYPSAPILPPSAMYFQHNQVPGSAALYHRMYPHLVNQSVFHPDLYNRHEKSNISSSPSDHPHQQSSSPTPAETIHTPQTVSSGLNLQYVSKPETPAISSVYNMPLDYSFQTYNSAMLTPPSSNSPNQHNIISPSPGIKQEMDSQSSSN